MTERTASAPRSPKSWRGGESAAWARSRGWGPWLYSLTFGVCWGLFVWLSATVIELISGKSSWSGIIADPRETRDDFIYWLTAGLLVGAAMFLFVRRDWNDEAPEDDTGPGSGKARFLVENTFPVTNRGVFVIQGSILSGAVQPGQRVRAPAGIDARIDAIQLVQLSATGTREIPGLVFRYRSADELARWEALELKGQALELDAPTLPDNARGSNSA